MAPKKVDKTERVTTIATGALDVFSRVGFEKATVAQIASECGVGKGTVYEYFESKEELFLESVGVWMKQIETKIGTILNEESAVPGGQLEQLSTYLAATFDAYTTNPYSRRMSVILTHLMIGHHDWVVKSEFLATSTASFREAIAALIRSATETGELPDSVHECAEAHAINLIAGMDGLELHAAISSGLLDSKKQSRIYIETYINGLKSA